MSWLSHQQCPMCPSSDAFSYNTESKSGKCHACSKKYPERGVKYSSETLEKYPTWTFNTVFGIEKSDSSSKEYKGLRGITAKTMEHYGVESVLDSNGDVIKQMYVYPSGGVKTRTLPKKFMWSGGKQDELFGMNLFSAGVGNSVTICEGELDAMSAYQMLGGVNSQYQNAVVSVPSGTVSGDFWKNTYNWLNSFPKIIMSIEDDQTGTDLQNKINNLFPGKVYKIDNGKYKDANEWLQSTDAKNFKSAWFGASKYTPDNVLHSAEDLLELYTDTPDHQYIETGIQELDDKIMGLMESHFTVFKAPTGIGKTELMRYLENNFLERGIKFASWHMEETKLRSLLGLVSYKLNDDLTRRDLIEVKGRDEDVKTTIREIAESGLYFQYFLKDGQGVEELLQQIRFFKEAYDCKFVMFEPIQDAVTTSSEAGKEAELAELSIRLSKLAAEINVGIITIAHTNEEGDMKYCKMIGQKASVIVSLSRDKSADGDDRNITKLYVEKNRPTSLEGYAGEMRFNLESFTMKEEV
jgi:hypothetical protein